MDQPLWLSAHRAKDGLHYGCRQTSGKPYSDLYIWLDTVSYVNVYSDWPRDVFYFSNPADEAEFNRRYGPITIDEDS